MGSIRFVLQLRHAAKLFEFGAWFASLAVGHCPFLDKQLTCCACGTPVGVLHSLLVCPRSCGVGCFAQAFETLPWPCCSLSLVMRLHGHMPKTLWERASEPAQRKSNLKIRQLAEWMVFGIAVALPDLICQPQIAVGTAGLHLPQLQIAVGTAGLQLDCQIRVGTAGLHLPAPDRSGHCRTSAATARSQWALPDFIRDCQIAVGTAGPHLRMPDRSGHCQTSAATARSQWALPDFSRDCQIAVGTAGLFSHDCQIAVGTAGLQPRLPDRSGHCRTSVATARAQWALPDFSRDYQICAR
eukprot:s2501_g6.t1